jgi:predicted nuclease with RNAse H fold
VRSLGVDVGVRKGLDTVLLDDSLTVVETSRHVRLGELGEVIDRSAPDVIAIDSPPAWGSSGAKSRAAERELRRLGIISFATPSDPRSRENRFYEWMTVGFEVFRIAEEKGYPRYAAGPVRRTAVEVFPHGSAVVLAGSLPRQGVSKREWRARVLQEQGVATDGIHSADQVDAALAALTGLLVLLGRFVTFGDPEEGVIILPGDTVPREPYRRAASTIVGVR